MRCYNKNNYTEVIRSVLIIVAGMLKGVEIFTRDVCLHTPNVLVRRSRV